MQVAFPLRESEADRCSRPEFAAQCADHFDGESRSCGQCTSVGVCAPIRTVPQEQIRQIPFLSPDRVALRRAGLLCGGRVSRVVANEL
jgi:hypothetical protein